jgi:hypothetical protein
MGPFDKHKAYKGGNYKNILKYKPLILLKKKRSEELKNKIY